MPLTGGHVVPANTTWAVPDAAVLAPFSTSLTAGCREEKLLPLLLPLCLHHSWLKVAKHTKTSQAMAVAIWPRGVVLAMGSSNHAAIHSARRTLAAAPPTPLKKHCTWLLFLLKYDIKEMLPSALIGPTTCPLSEPSEICSAGHSRSFENLSVSEAGFVVSSTPTKRQHTRNE